MTRAASLIFNKPTQASCVWLCVCVDTRACPCARAYPYMPFLVTHSKQGQATRLALHQKQELSAGAVQLKTLLSAVGRATPRLRPPTTLDQHRNSVMFNIKGRLLLSLQSAYANKVHNVLCSAVPRIFTGLWCNYLVFGIIVYMKGGTTAEPKLSFPFLLKGT